MVWELGANMGHIDRMLVTARVLRSRGHEVVFVLKDLAQAYRRVVAEGFAVLQAPVWLPRMAKPSGLVNFSAVLAAAGWLDAAGLAGLLSGWRSLYHLYRPDLLLCDHAPTAMLAARGASFPVAAVGSSFHVPPVGESFPALHYWDETDRAACARSDAIVLRPANAALAALGEPPMPRLASLFADVLCIVSSLPELTHYPDYPAAGIERVGPTFIGDSGDAPQWPDGPGARVFVYLSPEHVDFTALMAALRAPGFSSLVHAGGLSQAAALALGAASIRFAGRPVRIDDAMKAADIVITHAGIGTVSAAALAGRVQLVIPNHMEQYMVGRRVVEAGIGLMVPPGSQGADYRALLQALRDDASYAAASCALADRHAAVRPETTGRQIVDVLERRLPQWNP